MEILGSGMVSYHTQLKTILISFMRELKKNHRKLGNTSAFGGVICAKKKGTGLYVKSDT